MTQYAEGSTSFSLNIDSSGLDGALRKASELEEKLNAIDKARTISIKIEGASARSLNSLKDILSGKNSILSGAKDAKNSIGSMGDALKSGIKDEKIVKQLKGLQGQFKDTTAQASVLEAQAKQQQKSYATLDERRVKSLVSDMGMDLSKENIPKMLQFLGKYETLTDTQLSSYSKKYNSSFAALSEAKEKMTVFLNDQAEVKLDPKYANANLYADVYDSYYKNKIEGYKKAFDKNKEELFNEITTKEAQAAQERKRASKFQNDFFDIYDNVDLEDEKNRVRRPTSYEVNIVTNVDQLSAEIDKVIKEPRTIKVQVEADEDNIVNDQKAKTTNQKKKTKKDLKEAVENVATGEEKIENPLKESDVVSINLDIKNYDKIEDLRATLNEIKTGDYKIALDVDDLAEQSREAGQNFHKGFLESIQMDRELKSNDKYQELLTKAKDAVQRKSGTEDQLKLAEQEKVTADEALTAKKRDTVSTALKTYSNNIDSKKTVRTDTLSRTLSAIKAWAGSLDPEQIEKSFADIQFKGKDGNLKTVTGKKASEWASRIKDVLANRAKYNDEYQNKYDNEIVAKWADLAKEQDSKQKVVDRATKERDKAEAESSLIQNEINKIQTEARNKAQASPYQRIDSDSLKETVDSSDMAKDVKAQLAGDIQIPISVVLNPSIEELRSQLTGIGAEPININVQPQNQTQQNTQTPATQGDSAEEDNQPAPRRRTTRTRRQRRPSYSNDDSADEEIDYTRLKRTGLDRTLSNFLKNSNLPGEIKNRVVNDDRSASFISRVKDETTGFMRETRYEFENLGEALNNPEIFSNNRLTDTYIRQMEENGTRTRFAFTPNEQRVIRETILAQASQLNIDPDSVNIKNTQKNGSTLSLVQNTDQGSRKLKYNLLNVWDDSNNGFNNGWMDNFIEETHLKTKKKLDNGMKGSNAQSYLNKLVKGISSEMSASVVTRDDDSGVIDITKWDEATQKIRTYRLEVENVAQAINHIKNNENGFLPDFMRDASPLSFVDELYSLAKEQGKYENNKRVFDEWESNPASEDRDESVRNKRFQQLKQENEKNRQAVSDSLDAAISQARDNGEILTKTQLDEIESFRKGTADIEKIQESRSNKGKSKEDLSQIESDFTQSWSEARSIVKADAGFKAENGEYQNVIGALDEVKNKFIEVKQLLATGLHLSAEDRKGLEKELDDLVKAPSSILSRAGKEAKKSNQFGIVTDIDIAKTEKDQKKAFAEYIKKKQGGKAVNVKGKANGSYKVTYRMDDRVLTDQFHIGQERADTGEMKNVVRQKNTGTQEYISPAARFAEGVQSKIKSLSEYIFSIDLIQRAWNEIQGGFSFVKSMNDDLTTINMTMDTSSDKLQELGTNAIKTGQELGSNAENVMNAVKIYANANETTDSILEKAKPTVMLANASGVDTAVAADQIQGVVQQFDDMEGQERRIVNSYEKISAGLAIDFAQGINGMSDAIQNSGSVANEAGLAFETYAAMVGKIQEKTRNEGSSIGNMAKTMFARISRSKTADPEVTADDRSNAAKAYHSIGIDLYDKNGQYQDLNKTLDELSAKWETMSDAEQNYIAEQSSGTRGINVFRAMMDTYDDAKLLAQSAVEDTTFIDDVQGKHDNSISGQSQKLRASVEGIWNNILDSGTIKLVMDMGAGVVNVMNGITGAVNSTGKALLGANSGWLTLLATLKLVNGVWSGSEALKSNGNLIDGAKGFASGLFSGSGMIKNALANVGHAIGIGSDSYIISNTNTPKEQIPNSRDSLKSMWQHGSLVRAGFWKKFKEDLEAGYNLSNLDKNAKEETKTKTRDKLNNLTGLDKIVGKFGELSGKVGKKIESTFSLPKSLSAGSSALITGGGLAIGAAIAGVVGKVLYDKVTEPARMREQAETTSQTYQTEMASIKKERKTFKELYDEWEPLSRGVHPTNGENVSLSNADYKKYQDLSTQIGNIVPEAVAAYDEYNNAILNQTQVLRAATEKFNNASLTEAQKVIDANDAYQKTFEDTTISKPVSENKPMLASGTATQDNANIALSKYDKKKAVDAIMDKTIDEIQDSWNASGVFKGLDSRSKEYLESTFGLKGITNMSADTWDKKRVELKAASEELGASVESDRTTFMTLLDALLTKEKVRNDDRKEGKVPSEVFDELSAVLNKTTTDQILENNKNGITPEQYVQQWVDAFRAQGDKLTPILENLRSITPDSSFEDIRSYFNYDLPTLANAVNANQAELAKALGLEDQQKMLDSYERLIRSQSGFTDKLKPLSGERLASSPWDNLRTVDDKSGYFARYQATDNNRMAIVASPILPDGSVLSSEALEKAMTDILNGTDIDTDLQYQLFNGKDANKEARKFAKEINKGTRGIRDVTSDIDDFIAKKGINTANDLDTLRRLMEQFKGMDNMWDMIDKSWDLERYDPSAIAEKLKTLEQNLTSVSNALNTLDSAQQASSSSSGLMREEIKAVQDVFSSLDSFNYDSLFESTAEGVHMNVEELDRLNSEYRKFNLDKYKNEYQDILQQYEAKRKYIAGLGDSEQDQVEKKVQLKDMNDLRARLQEANELQSMYEGLTNSVALYQRAIKLGEEGDTYDYLAKTGYEGAKKRYDMGEVGTREFKSFAQMLTNEDLAGKGVGAYLQAYEANIGKFHEIFTEDPRQGIFATIQKLEKAGLAVGDSTNGWAINADLQEMADTLGVSDALATEVAKKLNDFGAQLKFSEETDYLKDLRKTAQQTFDSLDESLTKGLEVKGTKSSLDEVNDEIEKIQKRQQELRVSGNEQGAKQLDSLLDYTKQLKVELEVGLEVDNSEETIDSLDKHLSSLKKKYSIDIDINWGNNDPQYYTNKIKDLREGLEEASEGKPITVGSELYNEAYPVAEQLIAREQAANRPELASMNVETIDDAQVRQAVTGFQTIQAAVENYNRLNVLKKELNFDIPDTDIQAGLENIQNAMLNFEKENPSVVKALQKQFGNAFDFSSLSPDGFEMLIKDLEAKDLSVDADGNIKINLSKGTVKKIKEDVKKQVEQASKEGADNATVSEASPNKRSQRYEGDSERSNKQPEKTPSPNNRNQRYAGDSQYSDDQVDKGKKQYYADQEKESKEAEKSSKYSAGDNSRSGRERAEADKRDKEASQKRLNNARQEEKILNAELQNEKRTKYDNQRKADIAQRADKAERDAKYSAGDDTRSGKENTKTRNKVKEYAEKGQASSEGRASQSKTDSRQLNDELSPSKKEKYDNQYQREKEKEKQLQNRNLSAGDDTRSGRKNAEEYELAREKERNAQNKLKNAQQEEKRLNDELNRERQKKYDDQQEAEAKKKFSRENQKAKVSDDNLRSGTSALERRKKEISQSFNLRDLAEVSGADVLKKIRKQSYDQWQGASKFAEDPLSLSDMNLKERSGVVKYLADTKALNSMKIEDRKAYVDYVLGDIPDFDAKDKEVVVDYIVNDKEIKDLDFDDQEVMIKYWAETGELSDQVDKFTAEEKVLHIKTLMETGEVDNWTPDEKQSVVVAVMNTNEVDYWTPEDKQAFANYLLNSGAIDSWTPEMKEAYAQYLVDSGIVDGWTPEQKQAWAKYLVNSGVVDRFKPGDKQAYINYLLGSTPNYDPPNFTRYVNYIATNGGSAQPALQTNRPFVIRYPGDFNGTAHALGTVASKAFNKVRNAFALGSGDWGAKQSGKSLIGELGPEIRVRGHRFDILGRHHAEIADVRKGDIIFNHRFCGYKIH